jgi:HlyD family secretion protein
VEEGGKVTEKVIEEGELVKKGDVIIRMVNNDLNINKPEKREYRRNT